MGTRADFYCGQGEGAKWLGSIAWDGNPSCILDEDKLGKAENVIHWCKLVEEFLKKREDKTLPAEGWPWPWDDSQTTDYAYSWDNGEVYVSDFGSKPITWKAWQEREKALLLWEEYDERKDAFDDGKADEPPLTPPMPRPEDLPKTAIFPNMKDQKKVKFGGPGSGLMIFKVGKGD